MKLRPGMRLQSVTCDTNVIVVRAPADDVDLRCGGAPMVAVGEAFDKQPLADADGPGTLMGKRYGSDESGMELLCTKPGKGTLSVGAEPVPVKEAKALPSSD